MMRDPDAIEAATEQLKYWQAEFQKANDLRDVKRVQLCARFCAQCELVIKALEGKRAEE